MKVLPHLPFAEGNRYNSQKRTSSGYSMLPLLLRVVTSSGCFGDQYCFVWEVWALVLRSHLRYRVRLSSGGKSHPLGRM